MIKEIERVKDELFQIYHQYLMLQDKTYDMKITILREQMSVLEDIVNDELGELVFDWEISLDQDKKDHYKYK